VKRIPTTLLVVLFLGYATVFVRVPAAGLRLRPVFDPFEPRPRLVEQLIVARQYAKALPLAQALRVSFPNEPQIVSDLATMFRGLNDSEAEAAAWEDYLRLSGAPAVACPALPEAYRRVGDPGQALRSYERCLALDPENADRLFDLADAYERSERSSEAIALYRRAAASDPFNPVVTARIASLTEKTR
jgi:tetratricopeptide (TPR) repeat protein